MTPDPTKKPKKVDKIFTFRGVEKKLTFNGIDEEPTAAAIIDPSDKSGFTSVNEYTDEDGNYYDFDAATGQFCGYFNVYSSAGITSDM